MNPMVIVEFLSDSTEDSDRTEKFAAYRRLPSLREYVLISQRERRLEALLAEHRGNISQVARELGKARMQVQRWLKRFGLDPARYR